MRMILIDNQRHYPLWDVDDVNKLIHQSAMGNEHAIRDEDQVREFLLSELRGLGPGPDESLIDPISPDGSVVRVHLRPFSALNLNEEFLFQAFVHTAKTIPPSGDRLIEYADLAAKLVETGDLQLNPKAFVEYIERLRAAGFPAVHHSQRYEQQYKPAYRVIAREVLPEEIYAHE